jgi:hypothetical protein
MCFGEALELMNLSADKELTARKANPTDVRSRALSVKYHTSHFAVTTE